MKSRSLTAACLLAVANALLEVTISKQTLDAESANHRRHILRRDGTTDIDTFYTGSDPSNLAYYTTISAGTPPQSQQLLINTGGSDTYLLSPAACGGNGNPCAGTYFNTSASSTYREVLPLPRFNTSFVDGTTVNGSYISETLTIGDVSLANVELGLLQQTGTAVGYTTGQLALGYSANEANGASYPTVIEVLKESGAIASRLFSLYLDGQDNTGSILFGGIDTSRFSGPLTTLNLIPPANRTEAISQFITSVTGLSATAGPAGTKTIFTSTTAPGSGTGTPAWPVGLFIGSSGWWMPTDYWTLVLNTTFPFVDTGNLSTSCEHRNDDITLHVQFAGQATINLPIRNLIQPLTNSTTHQPIVYPNGTAQCSLLLYPDTQSDLSKYGVFSMGDSVLSSMYTVFDLDNGQVSIAQAVINSTATPNIKPISSGLGGVASAVSSVVTASSNTISIATPFSISANTYFLSTVSTSSSSTSTPTTSSSGSTTPTAKSAAVGLSSKHNAMLACCVFIAAIFMR